MSDNGQVTVTFKVGGKVSNEPFPTREELLKRNSFPGPDQNKYLNRMWGCVKNET
ncbi:TPA_asm: DUF2737 family protein [Salmonella enterica subsp. enterica serovar Typhimurium]|uniref:DUF2737 family protein n=8 Tax=root TaxID=1 RepID=A0A7T8ITB3_9CAUD|nr:hypothetical protein QA063_gp07 [Salmonella phage vB_SenS_ER1]QQO87233.1 hypothetical protein OBBPKPMC_00011 [Salmonella phage vB_SenS_ER11]QQO87332.1 hypothetical protein EMMCPFOG_00045 [Salmonella phage vB_SenS_ER12]QQO87368.1 hypothetical protein IDEPFFIH_00016 [Salmonella phage vB_SenS_ER13]QQO87477.1 hypothetical protein JLDPDKKA_00059 [Salmonella phage vB_SenS_ER14]QQO87586.1 hypothetical protein FGMODNKE_00037 [Salmonella phage vB_SenS_ER16]QQO87901.1 hypothetical protein DLMACAEP_0